MKQIPLPLGPTPLRSFGNFVPGLNAAAVEQLRGLVLPSAPVYLWGPAGSGKSHLLHALVQRCQSQGQQVGWFNAGAPQPWTLQPARTRVDAARIRANRLYKVFLIIISSNIGEKTSFGRIVNRDG